MDDVAVSLSHKLLESAQTPEQKSRLEKMVIPQLTAALLQLGVNQPEDPYLWLAKNFCDKTIKAEWVEHLVLKLNVGDFFGEIALLSHKPRQATVKATRKTEALVLSRDGFSRLCGSLVDVLKRNMDTYESLTLPEDEDIAEKEDEAQHTLEPENHPMPEFAKSANRKRRSCVFVEPVQLEEDWVAPSFEKDAADETRLQDLLSKTALLAALEASAKKTIVGAFQKKSFATGSDVIKEGDDGDYFYILDEGSADVFKKIDGEEKKVFAYSSGGSFGELALLHGEPRLATVRAVTDCQVWALDRDTFRKIMMSAGKQSMDERSKFINKVKLFDELQPYEKFRIAEAMELRHFNEGDVIISEGDPGEEFFIIQSGACNCYKKSLKF
mmetsp:Transcript_25297/g.51488  ORF Transcript_25297/g.51488 Transcript_25297/m.51488 type:complete len:384 (+) Transcript_25297:144-1295(+)|eukprot:CAMPEP_0181326884 /NCGR_PEP_ID=MMETSP1101-20121128/21766_1 /TAXON_ID=46948 /ORGANISM="Rhodomonas abbreviata, Strain Caron Lab Isolate" /LENGTH=383 /DNA_ID=CAMNT_0023435427 /DNA_START=143 /DNA_END=1294 /DNA_ORIENTATION=+